MENSNIEDLLNTVEQTIVEESGKRGGEVASETHKGARSELSAAAIARLIGLATSSDARLLEGKVDLLLAKISLVSSRLDKVIAELDMVARGADIDRIEVQLTKILEHLRGS